MPKARAQHEIERLAKGKYKKAYKVFKKLAERSLESGSNYVDKDAARNVATKRRVAKAAAKEHKNNKN
jgi:hypothetical protein